MKHVFIGPRNQFIYTQYYGFKGREDSELVLIGDRERQLAKTITYAGLDGLKISKSFYDFSLDRNINKIISQRKWSEEICFIIYSRMHEHYGKSIIEYLRDEYKDCIIICYYGDIVASHQNSIADVKQSFDFVFTFDARDAREFGLHWCLEPFSGNVFKSKKLRDRENIWDVTFVGEAKNRYEKIIRMYELLRKKGLKCDFHITGVKARDRLYGDEISYSGLSFMDLLEHVACSKCVAEVLQDGGESPTTRYAEAMLMGKNILTDCAYFKDIAKRSENVLFFDNADEIEDYTSEDIIKNSNVDVKENMKRFSIKSMIDTIDGVIGGQQ